MTDENWTHVSDRKRYGIGEYSAWLGRLTILETE